MFACNVFLFCCDIFIKYFYISNEFEKALEKDPIITGVEGGGDFVCILFLLEAACKRVFNELFILGVNVLDLTNKKLVDLGVVFN